MIRAVDAVARLHLQGGNSDGAIVCDSGNHRLVSGLASPSVAAGDEPKEATAVFHELIERLVDAEARADPAAIAALFAEDAVPMPLGVQEPIPGK